MPEIVLKNVTKKFGDFVAVDNLSMVIDDRAFVTLLGPSGCGKTTTLRMIAGLETPTEGVITIDGVTVYDSEQRINIPPSKRDVGFLFQNYALWPHMTVFKNISFGLENLKWSKEDIKARVNELLVLLKIEDLVGRYPSELSGGQQQRVAIARTLAPKPKVLFMDEPLSNLDAKLRLEMRTELKRLHRETSSTFVYVTHDQLEAMTLATEISLLKDGLLQQYEHPLKVYSRPANLFVADFVGNPTMNFIDVKLTKQLKTKGQFESNDYEFELVYNKDENNLDVDQTDYVLGIRPEYVTLVEQGQSALVDSTLPGGMETTVKLDFEEFYLHGVVFGIIDYNYNEEVKVAFSTENILLFDKTTGARVASGKLTFKKK